MKRPQQLPQPIRYRSVLFSLASVLAVVGCAAPPTGGEKTEAPALPRTAEMLSRQTRLIADEPALKASVLPADWVSVMNDPVLSALVARARTEGLDLQMAAQRVAQSAATLGVVAAQAQPQASLGASYAREAISANSPLATLGAYTGGFHLWDVGAQASWEIDFWGHLAHQTEAARARWQASQFQLGAAQVSLSAEVARQYLLLRDLQQQARRQNELWALAQQRVRLIDSRRRNGMATEAELASARADEAAAQATLPGLHQQAQALANGLARLLGKAPHALDAQLQASAELPPPAALPVGVPSERARQRPDVLQAEAQLRAAAADTATARSDFYPRITLSAGLGLEAFKLKDLGSWDSRQFSAGPALHLPLFEGGQLRQTLALTEARQREAALNYQGTVLKAWQEVDDALQQQVEGRRQWQHWLASEQQRQQALDSALRARNAGAADELTVIEARRALLASTAARQASATQVKLSAIALVRALGGGWAPTPNPAEDRT